MKYRGGGAADTHTEATMTSVNGCKMHTHTHTDNTKLEQQNRIRFLPESLTYIMNEIILNCTEIRSVR